MVIRGCMQRSTSINHMPSGTFAPLVASAQLGCPPDAGWVHVYACMFR